MLKDQLFKSKKCLQYMKLRNQFHPHTVGGSMQFFVISKNKVFRATETFLLVYVLDLRRKAV